jgi:hypothetical protein
MAPQVEQRTIATCVFRDHETSEHDRQGCPLVAALVRRMDDLELSDAPQDVEREIKKYRAVARVLDCPLIAKLAVQDLHALVVARQVSLQSEWAARPAQLAPVTA